MKDRSRAQEIPYIVRHDLLELSLSPQEAYLLTLINGTISREELLKIVPFPAEEGSLLLEELTRKGVIAWKKPQEIRAGKRGTKPPESAPQIPEPPPHEEDPLQALKAKCAIFEKLISSGDPFRVFQIKPGTPDEEVQERFRELSRQFHPDRYYHLNPPPELRAQLEEIYNALRLLYQEVATEAARRETFIRIRNLKPPSSPRKDRLDAPRLEALLMEALRLMEFENALKLLELLRQLDPTYPVEEKRKEIIQLSKLAHILEGFLGETPVQDLERIEKMYRAVVQAEEMLAQIPRLLYSATMFLYLYTEDVPRMQKWIELLLAREKKPEYYLLGARVMFKGENLEGALAYLEKIRNDPSLGAEARKLIKEIRSR